MNDVIIFYDDFFAVFNSAWFLIAQHFIRDTYSSLDVLETEGTEEYQEYQLEVGHCHFGIICNITSFSKYLNRK